MTSRPLPRLARWLVTAAVPAPLADDVLGDLEERWRREGAAWPVATWCGVTGLALSVAARAALERVRPLDRRWTLTLGGWQQDVRFAMRLVRRRPAASVAIVLTLALGVGAVTALFSVANSWLLRPLPFPDADRLVAVWETIPSANIDENTPAPAVLGEWQARAASFERLTALTRTTFNLTGEGDPARVTAIRAMPSVLELLGVQPLAGRVFTEAEGVAPAPRVVMLSHGFWRDRFGARAGVVGSTLRLDGEPYEVVGVLPPQATPFGMTVDVWTPLAFDAEEAQSGNRYLWVLGRLRPGVTVERASSEVDRLALSRSEGGTGGRAVALREQTVGSTAADVWVLFGASALVLVMACANVASLSLAQMMGRRTELVTRQAVGASRGRVVRQVVIESVTIGLLGGAGGWLVAMWSAGALASLAPSAARLGAVDVLDPIVFGFAVAATLATAVLFGLLPAWQSSRIEFSSALRAGGRGVSRGRRRTLAALVVAEIGVALVLLVATMLVVRSLRTLTAIDLGLAIDGVVLAEIPRPADADPRFHETVESALRDVGGIEGVAWSQALPLLSVGAMGAGFFVETRPADDPRVLAYWRVVNAGYFDALRIPIRAGRALAPGDRAGTPRVAVVSESFARRAWPGVDPIGKRIGWGTFDEPMTVVGVAGDVRHTQALEAGPHVYMPYTQTGSRVPSQIAVRSTLGAEATAAAIRRVVRDVDPAQPVANVVTADGRLWQSLSRRRFHLVLFGLFAGVAMILALVGVHGVLSFLLSERRRELGIRAALGATPGQLRVTWLRVGLGLVTAGLAVGLAAAWWASSLMRGFLFGIEPRDAAAYAVAIAIVVVAASIACLVPAARAGRVDPIEPLRAE